MERDEGASPFDISELRRLWMARRLAGKKKIEGVGLSVEFCFLTRPALIVIHEGNR